MFGRKKEKPSPGAGNNDSGAIIQGFVCPACLSSFGTSNDLEVHFQLKHSAKEIEEDEINLLRQQVSASSTTRELMQNEIARQLESIKALENNIASLTVDRNNVEVSLQQALLDLSATRSLLEQEKSTKEELARSHQQMQVDLAELRQALSSRPDSDQIQVERESAKLELERVMAANAGEVAKLETSLSGVKKTYNEFMTSLQHLLVNIESFEPGASESRSLSPECVEVLSSLQKQLSEKEKLKNSLREHEQWRERLVEERERLEKRLSSLEQVQLATKKKLFDFADHVSHQQAIRNSPEPSSSVSELDESGLIESIRRSFDFLIGRNQQLQSEIERNVTDEDVLKRLKQEYDDTMNERNGEVATLKTEVQKLEGIIRRNAELAAELAKLHGELDGTKQTLQVTAEAKDRVESELHSKIEALREHQESIIRLESALQNQQTDAAHATSSLTASEGELKRTKASLVEAQQVCETQKTTIEMLENEKLSKEKQCSDLETKIAELSAKLGDTSVKEKDTARKLSELDQALSTIRSEKDECLKQLSSRNELISQLERSLKDSLAEKERLLSDLERDRAELTTTSASLSSEVTAARAAVEAERSKASELMEKVKRLESSNDELASQHQATLAELSALRATSASTLAAVEGELKMSKTSLEELQQISLKSQQTCEAQKTMIEALESEKHASERKCEELAAQLHKISVTLDETARKEKETAGKLSELEQNLAMLQSEREEFVKQLASKSGQVSQLELSMKQAVTEKSELQAELERTRAELSTTSAALSSEITSAKAAVEEERQKTSELILKVKTLESSNNKMSAQHKEVYDEHVALRAKFDECLAESHRLKSETDRQLEAKEATLRSHFSGIETKLRSEMTGLLAQLEKKSVENEDLEDELNNLQKRYQELQLALQDLGREQLSLQIKTAKVKEHRWVDDSTVTSCKNCDQKFSLTQRKHHCRRCGDVFCNSCSSKSASLPSSLRPVRVCDTCFKELNA